MHLAELALQQDLGRQVRQAGVALWRGKAARVQLARDAPVRHLSPEAVRIPLQATASTQPILLADL